MNQYRKAWVGALVAALTALAAAVADDHLTAAEMLGAALTGLTTGLGVYQVPNAQRSAPRHRNPT